MERSMEESKNISAHYDADYFAWQRKVGEFTCKANRLKFEAFTSPEKNTLDFGCGGGFMLAGLPAKKKMGVEINPTARAMAKENGLEAVATIDEVPNDWADLIISDHALEHVPEPLAALRALLPKLKRGGKFVIVIPCENLDMPYDPADVNHHLYSWGPQSLANLFRLAGFHVFRSEPFFHKHFLYSHVVYRLFGANVFNLLCYLNGRLNWSRSNEIRLVAERK